ncbi:hypothetical protein DSLASN_03150 [Desulfoluna limicola]|uniref:TRASH domain-containing protein n=1 Tax=Desulfoluna limicola TaxID=2810562 RepID=A0ABN6EYE5_9BACT|nr:hypothetical protein [Desulfoluna limicola]BCS94683.1 hypothetical protein DSLASN_03150 [Desulfoluna limicola]
MKVLIILAIIYFVYRHFKNKMLGDTGMAGGQSQKGPTSADDVMIQDPECGVYFPLREGVPCNLNGESLSFCSTECRDAYMKKHS